MAICETCLHRVVCGKYTATGGVNKCEHYAEGRRGRWLPGYPISCSVCGGNAPEEHDDDKTYTAWLSPFCPYCGAKMDKMAENADLWVCCGAVIPEGRQVCPTCIKEVEKTT